MFPAVLNSSPTHHCIWFGKKELICTHTQTFLQFVPMIGGILTIVSPIYFVSSFTYTSIKLLMAIIAYYVICIYNNTVCSSQITAERIITINANQCVRNEGGDFQIELQFSFIVGVVESVMNQMNEEYLSPWRSVWLEIITSLLVSENYRKKCRVNLWNDDVH